MLFILFLDIKIEHNGHVNFLQTEKWRGFWDNCTKIVYLLITHDIFALDLEILYNWLIWRGF